MLSVAEATERILSRFMPSGRETIALTEGLGRVLAEPVVARLTQPPAAVSAMDGYAVRAADITTLPARLKVVSRLAAGQAPHRAVDSGEAARIFTGGQLPEGTDTIVIQENCDTDGNFVTVREGASKLGQHVRAAGLDFRTGDLGIPVGRRLTARDIGLAASMNWPWLTVSRKPRVALLSTGNELALPGDPIGPAQIVSSNSIALSAFVLACGGEPLDLGIARDNPADLGRAIDAAQGCDLLVTSGGASVGEHDLVQKALTDRGMQLDFWKIAMRPGKPLMFGEIGNLKVLGLPGNPVSSLVTATLFVKPAIEKMLGLETRSVQPTKALLACALPANDRRQDYLRATLRKNENGLLVAEPFSMQDSSMLSLIARADCLVVRPPHAAPASEGKEVEIVPLIGGCLSI